MPHQLLLVDNSVTIQRVVRLTFADEDVNVIAVDDGNQAVAAIEESPPDIVLADISLAGRNGYDIARHLRDTPRLAHIPVMLLRGAFDKVDDARALEVGCDRVLSKPFDPQVVIAAVRELLARPKKIAAPPASFRAVDEIETAIEVSTDIDEYLDHLDLAFADLAAVPVATGAGGADDITIELVESPQSAVAGAEVPDRLDAGVGPLSYASDRAAFDYPFETAAREAPAPARAAGSAAAAVPMPFELVEPSTPTPTTVVSDELIDEIATRVADRLMVRLSTGNVPDVVTAVAERLVRAEIERIKSRL